MIQDASSMDRRVDGRARRRIRILVLLAVTVSLAGAGALLYPSWSRLNQAAQSVERARLRLAAVDRGDLVRDVSVEGRVVAADQPTVVSPAQGTASILVRAGDPVTQGRPLARIDSPEVRNLLQQEESSLMSARADLERLKLASQQADLRNKQDVELMRVRLKAGERAMERAKALFEERLGSSLDYERSQDEVQVALLELAHAQEKVRLDRETADFEIRNRELQLQRQELVVEDLQRRVRELTVVSPVTGLVARVEVKDKDSVQPNQALLTVVDLSDFQIEISVPENYAGEIGFGTEASIQYEGREYAGRVKSISPEVLESQVRGIVVFSGPLPPGLKQNQRVSSRLILDSRPNVLKIPRGPFLENMGGGQVYVVEEDLAVLRPIKVGAVSVAEVEIVSGLEAGEQVVLTDLSRYEGAERLLLR